MDNKKPGNGFPLKRNDPATKMANYKKWQRNRRIKKYVLHPLSFFLGAASMYLARRFFNLP